MPRRSLEAGELLAGFDEARTGLVEPRRESQVASYEASLQRQAVPKDLAGVAASALKPKKEVVNDKASSRQIAFPLSQRIKAKKDRSLPVRLLDSWASLNDNIVRSCVLDHLIDRLKWYSEQSSCANIRVTLDQDDSEAGRRKRRTFTMNLFSSFREEFKNCGPEVGEFLLDFDEGYMRALPSALTKDGNTVPFVFERAARLMDIPKVTRRSCASRPEKPLNKEKCTALEAPLLDKLPSDTQLLDKLPFDSVWQLPLLFQSVIDKPGIDKDNAESFLDEIADLSEYTLRIDLPAFVLGLNDYLAFLQGAIASGQAIQTKMLAFCATAFLALVHILVTHYTGDQYTGDQA